MREVLSGSMLLLLACGAAVGQETGVPPIHETFARFIVPGHETEMDGLRQLFWNHYQPPAGPLATLWDEWMTGPTLWPAVQKDAALQTIREKWSTVLSTRDIDAEGYVATHQHPSIAHPQGWPFPFWKQGKNTWGWHFAIPGLDANWHATEPKTQEGWKLERGEDKGIADDAWNLRLEQPGTRITPPAMSFDTFESPFLQLRWRAKGLEYCHPFVEWTTTDNPEFSPERRMYFPAVKSDAVVYTLIPVYRHPQWKGTITGLAHRLQQRHQGRRHQRPRSVSRAFSRPTTPGTTSTTRITSAAARNYFLWTRDVEFLKANIARMRLAIRYAMSEFDTVKEGVVTTRWVGHEGRSGLARDEKGNKTIVTGNGIGNNYWDLLPMGFKDAYATDSLL